MSETTTQLAAGPALNALVAEQVMGIDPATFLYIAEAHGENGCVAAFGIPRSLAETQAACDRENARRSYGTPFVPVVDNVADYSGDMNAAWDVVEAMLARFLYPDVISSASGSDGVVWRCVVDSFTDPEAENDPWPVSAAAKTAPLAICRAALAASAARPRAGEART